MKTILATLLLVLTFVAEAQTKLSVMGSLNYNAPEVRDVGGVDADEKSDVGFGLGLRALMGITDQLAFRSGAGLVYKSFAFEVGDSEYDLSFVYLSIPLTVYWKTSNTVGLFGGSSLNAKFSDDCDTKGDADSCDVKDERALVFPLILGLNFNLTDSLGMELSYEHGITETADDIKVHSAIASLLYHF